MFAGEMDPSNAFVESSPAPAAPRPRTGQRCCCALYCAGRAPRFQDRAHRAVGRRGGRHQERHHPCRGPYAFGWLRTETGVHRLVRRAVRLRQPPPHLVRRGVHLARSRRGLRHRGSTPADLKVDTYRASGAGGQHVTAPNRRSASPTCRVASSSACQSDRSQHKNRSTAMKMLKAKLYEMEMLKRNVEKQARGQQGRHRWGSQIRSYVLDQSRSRTCAPISKWPTPSGCWTATSTSSLSQLEERVVMICGCRWTRMIAV